MSKYLFIESRDPFESPDVGQLYTLADELGQEGHKVTVYLIQNAVLAARSGSNIDGFGSLMGATNVKIIADDYSLGERGIGQDGLNSGVAISNMDELVGLMLEGEPKVIWH